MSQLPESAAVPQIVYLNGAFVPIEQAMVPVLDRGFIFGDGIYEVVPVYGGKVFRWPHHLARLKRSLDRIGIANPFDDAGWGDLVQALIARHAWTDQFIYMQVTRGVARRDHAFPAGIKPTVFAMSNALQPVSAEVRAQGVRLISLPDERWLHCDIKSTSLLGNVLARQAAADAGALECVQFRDGFMTEGSSSNIWVVRNGTIFGAPSDRFILEGIRVGLMSELAAACGIPFEVRRILREEVQAADEILLTSATKEVLAACELDGRPVGHGLAAGKPGPIYHAIYAAYQKAKA